MTWAAQYGVVCRSCLRGRGLGDVVRDVRKHRHRVLPIVFVFALALPLGSYFIVGWREIYVVVLPPA